MNKFYYEFSDHDYYGLVVVTATNEEEAYPQAIQLYVDVIAGESVEEVEAEAAPHLIPEEWAFRKFIYAPNTMDHQVKDLVKEYQEMESGVLLVDSTLV